MAVVVSERPMTKADALKLGYAPDEATVFALHRKPLDALAEVCPDEPEAFRDGVELRSRRIMVISADVRSELERDIRDFDAFVDHINATYGPGTATAYTPGGSFGLNL